MSDLWVEASRDIEAEAGEFITALARQVVLPVWPFLAGAVDESDFGNRMFLATPQIEAACDALAGNDTLTRTALRVESARQMTADFELLLQSREASRASRTSAKGGGKYTCKNCGTHVPAGTANTCPGCLQTDPNEGRHTFIDDLRERTSAKTDWRAAADKRGYETFAHSNRHNLPDGHYGRGGRSSGFSYFGPYRSFEDARAEGWTEDSIDHVSNGKNLSALECAGRDCQGCNAVENPIDERGMKKRKKTSSRRTSSPLTDGMHPDDLESFDGDNGPQSYEQGYADALGGRVTKSDRSGPYFDGVRDGHRDGRTSSRRTASHSIRPAAGGENDWVSVGDDLKAGLLEHAMKNRHTDPTSLWHSRDDATGAKSVHEVFPMGDAVHDRGSYEKFYSHTSSHRPLHRVGDPDWPLDEDELGREMLEYEGGGTIPRWELDSNQLAYVQQRERLQEARSYWWTDDRGPEKSSALRVEAGDFWGHDNWDTGEVSLHISNDHALYEAVQSICVGGRGTADMIRDAVGGKIDGVNDDEVDWDAIAAEFNEEFGVLDDDDDYGPTQEEYDTLHTPRTNWDMKDGYFGSRRVVADAACTHKPSKNDSEAGYDCCMFCDETGNCDGGRGECRYHAPTWDRWKEADQYRDDDMGDGHFGSRRVADTRYGVCHYCNGEGSVECKGCDGKGSYAGWQMRPDGSEDDGICTECDGCGKHDCTECNGTGKNAGFEGSRRTAGDSDRPLKFNDTEIMDYHPGKCGFDGKGKGCHKYRGWDIHPREKSVQLWHEKGARSYNGTHYGEGKMGYDFPEAIPKAVTDHVSAIMRRHSPDPWNERQAAYHKEYVYPCPRCGKAVCNERETPHGHTPDADPWEGSREENARTSRRRTAEWDGIPTDEAISWARSCATGNTGSVRRLPCHTVLEICDLIGNDNDETVKWARSCAQGNTGSVRRLSCGDVIKLCDMASSSKSAGVAACAQHGCGKPKVRGGQGLCAMHYNNLIATPQGLPKISRRAAIEEIHSQELNLPRSDAPIVECPQCGSPSSYPANTPCGWCQFGLDARRQGAINDGKPDDGEGEGTQGFTGNAAPGGQPKTTTPRQKPGVGDARQGFASRVKQSLRRRAVGEEATAPSPGGYYVIQGRTPVYGPVTTAAEAMQHLAPGTYVGYIGQDSAVNGQGDIDPFLNPMGYQGQNSLAPFGTSDSRYFTPMVTAKVREIADGIMATNPGIARREAMKIARETVARHPVIGN